ncbi:hypothetical protein PoB_005627800 [Plakobranchus ocellatus]|uniref:Uncharacterized protein n=1 Tax=Plakobranchus ocellatus TaxID=259542 RepID=A0AAV4CFL7_9GAST|nr:hypothetical protein PoB_005627800 [Plakobranchus ocellatus]
MIKVSPMCYLNRRCGVHTRPSIADYKPSPSKSLSSSRTVVHLVQKLTTKEKSRGSNPRPDNYSLVLVCPPSTKWVQGLLKRREKLWQTTLRMPYAKNNQAYYSWFPYA